MTDARGKDAEQLDEAGLASEVDDAIADGDIELRTIRPLDEVTGVDDRFAEDPDVFYKLTTQGAARIGCDPIDSE